MIRAAVAPSPTAEAICMVAPLLISPAAKTPFMLVCRWLSVLANPISSRSIPEVFKNSLLGLSPTENKDAVSREFDLLAGRLIGTDDFCDMAVFTDNLIRGRIEMHGDLFFMPTQFLI